MATIYNKIRENGLLWVIKRSFDHFSDILCMPCLLIQKARAIRAAKYASLQPRNANHAVFLCDRLQSRAIKIAYALKEVGWKVTLLHKESLFFDVSEYFCETRQFKNPWDALFIASNYFPIVFHVFSNYNFEVASIFIRYKPGKIIFDNYDVLTGMVKDDILKRYKCQAGLEQYCYINADGLCCRDLRVQYLKKELGYKLPPRLLFSEYCWPEGKFRKSPQLTDGIHVVYVGSIDPNRESTAAFVYELAALLSKNNVHLHIYPSYNHIIPELITTMNRFLKSDGDNSYVHIHETISPLNIRQEISKYHYGLLISTNNVDYGDNHDTYFQHQGDYLLPAKIFDYLDAGLFTFTQNARFTRFILDRCNGGEVVTSLEDIAQQCKHEPPHDTRIPKSLLLESNINRLTTFYLNLK